MKVGKSLLWIKCKLNLNSTKGTTVQVWLLPKSCQPSSWSLYLGKLWERWAFVFTSNKSRTNKNSSLHIWKWEWISCDISLFFPLSTFLPPPQPTGKCTLLCLLKRNWSIITQSNQYFLTPPVSTEEVFIFCVASIVLTMMFRSFCNTVKEEGHSTLKGEIVSVNLESIVYTGTLLSESQLLLLCSGKNIAFLPDLSLGWQEIFCVKVFSSPPGI